MRKGAREAGFDVNTATLNHSGHIHSFTDMLPHIMVVISLMELAASSGVLSPASYATLSMGRCAGPGHEAHEEGFVISSGGLSVSFCNMTAWTFRDLNATFGSETVGGSHTDGGDTTGECIRNCTPRSK